MWSFNHILLSFHFECAPNSRLGSKRRVSSGQWRFSAAEEGFDLASATSNHLGKINIAFKGNYALEDVLNSGMFLAENIPSVRKL